MKRLLSLVLVMLLGCMAALSENAPESAANKVADALGHDIAAIKVQVEKIEADAEAALHTAVKEAEDQYDIIRAYLLLDKIEITNDISAAYAKLKEAIAKIDAEAAKLDDESKAGIQSLLKNLEIDFALAKLWIAIDAIEVSSEVKELAEKAKTGIETGIADLKAEAAKLADAAKDEIEKGIAIIQTHIMTLESYLIADKVVIDKKVADLISEASLSIQTEFVNLKDTAKALGAEASEAIDSAVTHVEDFFHHLVNAIKGE